MVLSGSGASEGRRGHSEAVPAVATLVGCLSYCPDMKRSQDNAGRPSLEGRPSPLFALVQVALDWQLAVPLAGEVEDRV